MAVTSTLVYYFQARPCAHLVGLHSCILELLTNVRLGWKLLSVTHTRSKRRHDTQHDDTRHNDDQLNDTQHNKNLTLSK
jgi:hypothetical protein